MVAYHPLHDDVLEEVIRLKLGRIAARVKANHQAVLTFDESLIDAVLAAMAEGRAIGCIKVGTGEQGEFTLEVA